MTDQNKLNSFHVCVTINTMGLLSAVQPAGKIGAICCAAVCTYRAALAVFVYTICLPLV